MFHQSFRISLTSLVAQVPGWTFNQFALRFLRWPTDCWSMLRTWTPRLNNCGRSCRKAGCWTSPFMRRLRLDMVSAGLDALPCVKIRLTRWWRASKRCITHRLVAYPNRKCQDVKTWHVRDQTHANSLAARSTHFPLGWCLDVDPLKRSRFCGNSRWIKC